MNFVYISGMPNRQTQSNRTEKEPDFIQYSLLRLIKICYRSGKK